MPASRTLPSLWDFALSFYAKPQVAELCVDLQDTYGCNVCLLLGLGWLDQRSDYLSAAELARLELHIQVWTQQVVEPLRVLRRLLKEPVSAYAQDETQAQVRTLIKDAELLAEKKLLAEIQLWIAKFPVAHAANHTSNVGNYLQKLAAPTTAIELIQKNIGD